MPRQTIAAGLVAGLLDYVASLGADADQLMAQANIAPEMFADPDQRLPLARYSIVMQQAKAMTGDDALALHFGAAVGMAELSILGLVMEASPTMGAAFAQLQRYGRLALDNDGDGSLFELEDQDGKLFLVDRRSEPTRERTEETFAWLVCGPRRFLSRPHVLSVQVAFAPPRYEKEYERVFQCPVHFNATQNALELHPDIADWPVAQSPRYVFGLLCERADLLLARQKSDLSTRARLEAAMMPVLHNGDIGANEMASVLGCSRSTLFRRLADEGTSYSEVLDQLRQDMAVQYLRGRKVSVRETAYLLGFSDPAAFSRAFKRWTGYAPGRFSAEGV